MFQSRFQRQWRCGCGGFRRAISRFVHELRCVGHASCVPFVITCTCAYAWLCGCSVYAWFDAPSRPCNSLMLSVARLCGCSGARISCPMLTCACCVLCLWTTGAYSAMRGQSVESLFKTRSWPARTVEYADPSTVYSQISTVYSQISTVYKSEQGMREFDPTRANCTA